jgi:hypothetical protein
MTDISTQIKGATRQAASVLKGRDGIYSTLAKEHGEVSSLLNKALQEKSAQRRAELLDEIRIELLSHTYAEEETLYDSLERFGEVQQETGHSRREHQGIEQALRAVFAAAPDSPEQLSAIGDLRSAIEHHVEEEENDLFVRAEALLSRTDAQRLDERFAELKRAKKLQLESDGFGIARGPLESR